MDIKISHQTYSMPQLNSLIKSYLFKCKYKLNVNNWTCRSNCLQKSAYLLFNYLQDFLAGGATGNETVKDKLISCGAMSFYFFELWDCSYTSLGNPNNFSFF